MNDLLDLDLASLSVDTAPPPPSGGTLTRKQKAAIVVRLLLAEGVKLSLADLPETLQEELTRQMTTMRFVDRETLRQVADEFADEIDNIGLSLPGTMERALGVLSGTISPATARRLRDQAGIGYIGDPWEVIANLGAETLRPVMERESVQIAAVLLSKLSVPKAAELLGQIPGPRARKITYAVSQTSAIGPDAVRRIGLALAEQLDARPAQAFSTGPVERVGAILNNSTADTRDDVLAGLDETDEGFAREVRKAIFTFASIPQRITTRDVPKIVREIDQADLLSVMAGAKGDAEAAVDYVMENLSQRLADQMRDEIAEMQDVRKSDVEEAEKRIVEAIRQMEADGKIFFVAEEDE